VGINKSCVVSSKNNIDNDEVTRRKIMKPTVNGEFKFNECQYDANRVTPTAPQFSNSILWQSTVESNTVEQYTLQSCVNPCELRSSHDIL
jgi:hypothetical protein